MLKFYSIVWLAGAVVSAATNHPENRTNTALIISTIFGVGAMIVDAIKDK